MSTYVYDQYVDDSRLELEIRNSSITIALSDVSIIGEKKVSIEFKDILGEQDKETLDYIVANHVNLPITVRDSVELANVGINKTTKAITVANTKLEGSSTLVISHDFTDKTTWYQSSVRVESEILTISSGQTYASKNSYWINLTSGLVPYEHRISDKYAPIIRVNDAPVTSGFKIDYINGTVTFDNDLGGATVTADYSYATKSDFAIYPSEGKILKIEGTAVKFSKNLSIGSNQHILFQTYIGEIPLGSPVVYNNIKDFVKCATGEVTVIPSFGDMENDVIVISFDYITSKNLDYKDNVKVVMKINDDKPLAGEFGIITAKCISLDNY